ncbi:hypothetical protein TorRG33x02_162780 [Trema orientale]|uniref:Uncharacterized protein n=1 Tax=Trema orientale TaxID=63057 RepID=A0A2P5EQU4_TREOI|nr:hypothetical protein TorRG33x02_162780 [Trema orientale]
MAENAIVSRVLYCRIRGDNVEFENYEEWRIQVKTYLLGQGLCDVIVKAKAKGSKGLNNYNNKAIWKKKNAAALHAIQICCGSVAFSLIKNITSSKTAWATLARKYKEQQQNSRKQDNQEEKKEIEEGFQSQGIYYTYIYIYIVSIYLFSVQMEKYICFISLTKS